MVIRRHHILATYLVQVLAYSQDRVHEEADRLERATSDELIDRMIRAIAELPSNPHGALTPDVEPAP